MKGRLVRLSLLLLLPLLLVVWAYPSGDSASAQSAKPGRGRKPAPIAYHNSPDDDSSGRGHHHHRHDHNGTPPTTPPAGEFWEIDGNANTNDTNFLGTIAGINFDVHFRTDGLERMRIFKTSTPVFGDLDGLVEIVTNLRLEPDVNYSGDLIMPHGRWIGRDFGAAGTGQNRGNLDQAIGDHSLADGDINMSLGSWKGRLNTLDAGNLSQTEGDHFVLDGAVGIGYKGTPGNATELIDPDFYDVVLKRNHVRIGDSSDPVFPPSDKAALQIEAIGRFPGSVGTAKDHVVFIRSHNMPGDSSITPDGIAIQLDATAGANFTDATNNFLTFYDSDGTELGTIDSNPAGIPAPRGVRFKSGGADFAEYLEKMDPADTFAAGEIVGIFGGKVSREIQGADHILVITGAPGFVGNAPPAHLESSYVMVAFLGQVPVLVRGNASPGDLIAPSGLGDGTAVAIRPDNLNLNDLPDVVGTAWSSSVGVEGVAGYVTVALGLRNLNWGVIGNKPLPVPPVGIPPVGMTSRLRALEQRVIELETALQQNSGGQPSPGQSSGR